MEESFPYSCTRSLSLSIVVSLARSLSLSLSVDRVVSVACGDGVLEMRYICPGMCVVRLSHEVYALYDFQQRLEYSFKADDSYREMGKINVEMSIRIYATISQPVVPS